MKISKILLCSIIVFSLMLPFITFVYAAEKPKYVGINEGQEIIWNTEFNKGPVENYYKDVYGVSDELAAEAADSVFDDYKWKTASEAWKMYIVEMRDEKSADYTFAQRTSRSDEFKQVKFVYSLYYTKDKSDAEGWTKIDKLGTAIIWETDEELYGDLVWGNILGTEAAYIMNGKDPWLVAPKNLKWDDVVVETETILEDKKMDDDYSVATTTHSYFFQQNEVGVESDYDIPSPAKAGSIGCEIKFNSDGILYYYDYNYDGDSIVHFELDTIGGVYLIENWWWIALIAGAVLVGIIVIIVVIAMKRR